MIKSVVFGIGRKLPVVNNFISNDKQHVAPQSLDSTTEDEYSDDEIIPIHIQESPKQKIHSKLINNRESNDHHIYDAEPVKNRYLNRIDNESILPVSTRLSRRKVSKSANGDSSSSITSDSNINSNNLMDVTSSSDTEIPEGDDSIAHDERMDVFLNDQNKKYEFDNLINNNINAVLSEEHQPNTDLFNLVYNNRNIILNGLYEIGKEKITSKLPHIPFINSHHEIVVEQIDPPQLASPFESNSLHEVENQLIPTAITEQDMIDQQNYDHLINHLDDEIKIDIFLDSLDEETKMNLYHSLQKDLKIMQQDQQEQFKNVSILDKIQMFIIISVKLFMTGLKLFLPITKYLIYKFQNNQLYIFNNKNIDKFFDFILKFMNYLNVKLNNNEEFIDKIYQHDYVKAEENLDSMYSDLQNYLKPSYLKERFIAKDDFIKRNIYDYMVGTITKASSNEVKDYKNDPRYKQYYSNHQPNDVSMMKVAEQFFEELE